MPFYLRESNILPKVAGLQSVLIVPCRFCPAASRAVREEKPYIELSRWFLRTGAYESFIQDLRRRLNDKGIRTDVFDSRLPHDMVTCMWTSGRRRALGKRAEEFDGVLVLGCESVAETVRDAVGPSGCQVIQGMGIEGLRNLVASLSSPFAISLEVQGIIAVAAGQPAE